MNDPQSAWHGVTVHDQATADARIPSALLDGSPVIADVSPMTGPVDLTPWLSPPEFPEGWYEAGPGKPVYSYYEVDETTDEIGPIILAGVIVSGGDQPLHPGWVRSIRDQCVAAGVPFCFRGWGEWMPFFDLDDLAGTRVKADTCLMLPDGSISPYVYTNAGEGMARVGAANSGRLLDGKLWDQWPQLHGKEVAR